MGKVKLSRSRRKTLLKVFNFVASDAGNPDRFWFDGKEFQNGDKVLLVGQTDPRMNGVRVIHVLPRPPLNPDTTIGALMP